MDAWKTCAIALGTTLLLGCAHAGYGAGELRAPRGAAAPSQREGAVEFIWHSGASTHRGTIEAALPDGRRFRGTYVRPWASSGDYDVPQPSWSQRSVTPRWGGEAPWCDARTRTNAALLLNGPVLAHLESRDGTRMRCVFTLFEPDDGLLGGGQGDCQLSTREEVFDALLQASPEG